MKIFEVPFVWTVYYWIC